MHEDNKECHSGDKRDADKIQADSKPTHGAAEEVVGGLVSVQKLLISGEHRDKAFHYRQGKEGKKKKLKKFSPVMLHSTQPKVS